MLVVRPGAPSSVLLLLVAFGLPMLRLQKRPNSLFQLGTQMGMLDLNDRLMVLPATCCYSFSSDLVGTFRLNQSEVPTKLW